MPHVSFVALSGVRVCEPEMLELGMRLPGFQQRAKAIAELPALGLLTLAGMMPSHWSSSYLAAPQCDDELFQSILDEQPDLVAISALTASIHEAYALAVRLRKERIPVVLGGLHVSSCSDEAKKYADAIVVGQGEPVWRKLLHDLETGNLQSVYRVERNAILEEWPLPRFDLLGDSHVNRYTLQTQRGCPFQCEFCGASRLISKFWEKPNDVIRRELDAITERNSRPLIELADDNTFVGHRDWDSFFDLFENSNARWFTEADWRIGENPALLSRLSQSGCLQVLTGIESLVFRYPGMGAKQAELDRMLDAVRAIQESGVAVNGCFIVGAEGETHESLQRLTEFLLESPFAELQITLETPFPGTELYSKMKRQGRLLEDRDWSYYTLFDVTCRPDRLTVEELEQGFREVVANVFSAEAHKRRERIRRKVWKNNRAMKKEQVGHAVHGNHQSHDS